MNENLSPLPPVELYRTVRGHIEHEDNLVSQRLSWLLASQSFLFTAYAISLNGPVQLHSTAFEKKEALLMLSLPIVGIVSAILIWLSILAGMAAMRKLREDFEHHVDVSSLAGLPPIQTMGARLVGGELGPVLIPILFLAVWLVLLLRG